MLKGPLDYPSGEHAQDAYESDLAGEELREQSDYDEECSTQY